MTFSKSALERKDLVSVSCLGCIIPGWVLKRISAPDNEHAGVERSRKIKVII